MLIYDVVKLSTPSLGITEEEVLVQLKDELKLSTPSLGITPERSDDFHEDSRQVFQLPLSGSLLSTTPLEHLRPDLLSTPSLGIT